MIKNTQKRVCKKALKRYQNFSEKEKDKRSEKDVKVILKNKNRSCLSI